MSVLLFLLAFNAILELHPELDPIAYADDLVITTRSMGELATGIASIRRTSARLNLHLNVAKTHVISQDPKISAYQP